MTTKKSKGFTLIEILVVVGIIAVLSAVVLVAVNPARQFKLARDTQRAANINSILNAIHQNISEHRGIFVCDGEPRPIPTSLTVVRHGGGFPTYQGDLASCLVPDYLSVLPFDPGISGAYYASTTAYDTGYEIFQDTNGRITASSTGELVPSISATR